MSAFGVYASDEESEWEEEAETGKDATDSDASHRNASDVEEPLPDDGIPFERPYKLANGRDDDRSSVLLYDVRVALPKTIVSVRETILGE